MYYTLYDQNDLKWRYIYSKKLNAKKKIVLGPGLSLLNYIIFNTL